MMTYRVWTLVLGMAGCAAVPRHGSFVSEKTEVLSSLARDVSAKVAEVYAPERHSLRWLHRASDPFGARLSAALGKRGYVVRTAQQPQQGAVGLRYTLDYLKDTPLLRLRMEVEGHAWSRAYRRKGQQVEAAGPWVSLEGAR